MPVMAMVRPRPGGFCYTDAEFATMVRDADLLLEHSLDELVFGVLHADGRVDAAYGATGRPLRSTRRRLPPRLRRHPRPGRRLGGAHRRGRGACSRRGRRRVRWTAPTSSARW
ncbi:MAG: copper homeostasis protein CutC [Caldilineaceae bacterium]